MAFQESERVWNFYSYKPNVITIAFSLNDQKKTKTETSVHLEFGLEFDFGCLEFGHTLYSFSEHYDNWGILWLRYPEIKFLFI